jgi:sugar lactone lactonase YvrE
MLRARQTWLLAGLSAQALIAAVAPAAAQAANVPIGGGDIVITEFFEDLWRIDPATGAKTTLDPGTFNPRAEIIEFDAARRLVAVDFDQRLVRFDPAALTVTPLTTTLFPLASGIAVEQSGTILVAAGFDIFRVNPATGATTTLVNHDNVNGGFFNPFGIDVGPTGRIFVSEFFEDLWEINPATGAASQVPRSRDISLRDPLVVRSDGSLVSREFDTGNFLKINPATGEITTFATDVPTFVNGIALEADDHLVAASTIGVFRYDATTGAKTTLTPDETFFSPGGIAVAPLGSDASDPADFDGDGDVDGADLVNWTTGFGLAAGMTKTHGDADGDADVDGNDFLTWQRGLTGSSGAATAANAPEPSACMLLVLAALAMGPTRRRSASRCSRHR